MIDRLCPAFLRGMLAALLLCKPTAAEERPAFPAPRNTQDAKDVLSTPATALESIRMPEGFRVSLFAAEPDVQQPVAVTFDERGRLWVCEMYTYGDSRERFAGDLRDRVVILEDADGDGAFDRRTVFWDQARKLTSVEVGMGGVWLLCAPQLLFIPDRDRNDVPDGPPEVLLDGFNDGTVGHNIVNGLKWGPDGWLYGRHGIQATSSVGPPGASDSQRTRLNCCIWRYHPRLKTFEVVAQGTTNSWGSDWDEHGQMFFINTVIGHLWHVVPGAHYRRMYGVDFNPYTYQLLEQTADHFHWDTGEAWSDAKKQALSEGTSRAGGGHAHCGMTIYLGDNWPRRYRNTILTVNMHGRRLNNDRLERQGAGYVGRHGDDLFLSDDPWFRGVEVSYGPDGGVYITDWTDMGECHENDGVHRTSGRIFKVTYGAAKPPGRLDLAQLADDELVDLQLHPNDWYVRQARRILQERAAAGRGLASAAEKLFAIFTENPDVTRKLRALWCLWSIEALSQEFLVDQLRHSDEHVRTWAVKLLTDRGAPPAAAVDELTALAAREPSGLVQLFLASALQRLPYEQRWPLASALASRPEFADDPNLPLMLWYGIEPAVPAQPQSAVRLAEKARMPLVRRFIARRLTSNLETEAAPVDALLAALVRRDEPRFQIDLLEGMVDGLKGWRKAPRPAAWDQAAAVLARANHSEIQARVRDLAIVFGDGRAADELLRLVDNPKADAEIRRQALRTLIEARAAGLPRRLLKLLKDRGLVNEAIRGLAGYDNPEIPEQILAGYARLDPDGRGAAITTLVARPAFAEALLDALAEGRVARSDVSAYHARQIQSFGDARLAKRLADVWGEARATDSEKRAQIENYRRALTPERLAQADLSAGRAVFAKTCANCHVLYGQGKTVGPDLTGGNRSNLEYLLENLLDPSAQVAADFRMTVVLLKSGRVITGLVTGQSPATLTLQTQTETVTIVRDEIDEQRATTESLMPEGLLKTLSDDQVRDLFGYLTGSAQVPLPDEAP